MGDLLEQFVDETALTVANVRELVDDYSLISHYLGQELELQTKYSSPLRKGDEHPSFSIFYGYDKLESDKLYFKDQIGTAHGDVFEFLRLYLGAVSIQAVLEQVNFDLKLGLNGEENNMYLKPTVIKKVPRSKERPKLDIVSIPYTRQFLMYWHGKYGVVDYWLKYYNTKCVHSIHYVYSNKTSIIVPKTLTIGYPIGAFNKIYMPYESKENRFRNDYPQNYVEGHLQIDWSRNDLLVITKASKEIIFFRNHWNIQSVAGKSETTFIPDFIMQQYLKHFKRVVLWLDPDEAGVRSMNKYKELYPKLEIPNFANTVEEKDPTDIYEVHRYKFTTELVAYTLQIPLI